jgi:multiple antibiotic resistance protein
MDWAAFGEAFVTLLVIMDPVGNAPIFISVTGRLTPRERQAAARRAVLAAGALVLGFAAFGDAILHYLNVSIESLSIAGGLLLLLVSLEMLRGMDSDLEAGADVALVPLATPLVAGPGTIATAIVLSRQNGGAGGRVAVTAAILAALVVVWLTLAGAERISRFLPDSVSAFLTRVFGLLLAAIAVQLVVDGVTGLTD